MSPPLCRGVGDLLSVLGKALGQGMSPTLPILLHVSGDGSQPALEGVRLSLARPLSPPAGRAGLSHSRREGCAEAMGEKKKELRNRFWGWFGSLQSGVLLNAISGGRDGMERAERCQVQGVRAQGDHRVLKDVT